MKSMRRSASAGVFPLALAVVLERRVALAQQFSHARALALELAPVVVNARARISVPDRIVAQPHDLHGSMHGVLVANRVVLYLDEGQRAGADVGPLEAPEAFSVPHAALPGRRVSQEQHKRGGASRRPDPAHQRPSHANPLTRLRPRPDQLETTRRDTADTAKDENGSKTVAADSDRAPELPDSEWSRRRELNPQPTDYEADQNTRFDADLRYNPASVCPETRLNRGHLSHRRPLVPIETGQNGPQMAQKFARR